VGLIRGGLDAGHYVKVLDDRGVSGGFLILTARSREMADGYDNWVPDWGQVEKFFQESGWTVDWFL